MGFWDTQLADLEAIGITLEPLEEHILEEGGEVLHLRHLAHPESTMDYIEGFYDQNDEPVLVVEKLRVESPMSLYNDWQYHNTQPILVCEAFDHEFEDWWRRYPTYPALLEHGDHYSGPGYASYQEWRTEALRPYRFWSCAPSLDDRVYEMLATACRERIYHSQYWDLELLSYFQTSDDYWVDVGSVWLDRNDPGKLTETEEKYLSGWYEGVQMDEEHIQEMLDTYERLVENEIVAPPWLAEGESVELKPIEMQPMEAFLTDPWALEVWNKMVGRSRYVRGQLRAASPNPAQFDHAESEYYV